MSTPLYDTFMTFIIDYNLRLMCCFEKGKITKSEALKKRSDLIKQTHKEAKGKIEEEKQKQREEQERFYLLNQKSFER